MISGRLARLAAALANVPLIGRMMTSLERHAPALPSKGPQVRKEAVAKLVRQMRSSVQERARNRAAKTNTKVTTRQCVRKRMFDAAFSALGAGYDLRRRRRRLAHAMMHRRWQDQRAALVAA